MGRGKGVRTTSASSIGISFQYRGARCREKLKLEPTNANKKYAERLKATIEHEIATGTFDYSKHFPNSRRARRFDRVPGQSLLIGDQLYAWLKTKKGKVTPETWSEYEKDIIRHLDPKFGAKRLRELVRGEVSAWAEASGLSIKRITNILIPLRSMYLQAMNAIPPLADHNPAADIEFNDAQLRTLEGEESELIEPFEPEEIAAIVANCAPSIADMVTFWVWTGLRPQEIFPLRWDDIDWRGNSVRVRRALREGRIKVTKTAAGRRDVGLQAPALQALQRQKARTFLAGGEIFLNPRTGEPWAGDGAFRKTAWSHALKRANVRYRYPGQLRHTFASWQLSAGESPLWVANQMGHKDWSQIVKTYGKWIPKVDTLAGKRAAEAIYGHESGTVAKK